MNRTFENLPEEKKHQIIKTCMAEFATNGYENTSTNKITEKAKISKGLLFHYFKNKKGLYLYLLKQSADIVYVQIYERLKDLQEEDFFERIKKTAIMKMEIFSRYPDEYQLLLKSFLDTPKELEEEITALFKEIQHQSVEQNQALLFSYLNESELREGLTVPFVLEYVMTVMEQFNRSILQQYKGQEEALLKHPEPLLERLNQYIDVIKHGVYR